MSHARPLTLVLDLRGDLNAVASLKFDASLLPGLPSVDLASLVAGIQLVGGVLGSLLIDALGEFTLPTFDFEELAIVPIAAGAFDGASGAAAWSLLE